MYRNFFKRKLDLIVASMGLVIVSPVLLIVIFILTISNKGKVFFSQERPGLNEKIFRVIKFRSMNDKRDDQGNLLPDWARLTPVGKFIRAASIDEIPQLINVLKGEMSLIGPRPLLQRYLSVYTEREKQRHTVRPGITGLAQISGRNALDWDARLEMDVCYTEDITFTGDIKILWNTIINVIKRKGVIADKQENYLDNKRKNQKK